MSRSVSRSSKAAFCMGRSGLGDDRGSRCSQKALDSGKSRSSDDSDDRPYEVREHYSLQVSKYGDQREAT